MARNARAGRLAVHPRPMKTAFFWMLLLGMLITPVLADGGKVRLSQVVDTSYRVTVFTSPTPLQVGLVDISVLVQNEQTSEIVQDAVMHVRCQSSNSNSTVHKAASHAEATNLLLQSAKLELDDAGLWQFELQLDSPVEGVLSFPLSVAAETTSVSMVTLLVALPFVFVCLYLLRERLRKNGKRV